MQPPGHPQSHYGIVPIPSHPHPPPPPHHPPSLPPPRQAHSFASDTNGGPLQDPYSQAMTASTLGTSGYDGTMRFGIPLEPNPTRVSGIHKKDIKRRTKTGCLTCRKRRIKCDEGQPTCRNCQKSKRECLGYDPIFKQPPPGHTAIQPAPAHSPPQTPDTGETAPPVPVPYYAHLTALGPSKSGYTQPTSRHSDQSASLDPALASSSETALDNMASNGPMPGLKPYRDLKPITMDDLFSLDDIPPIYPLWDQRPQLPQREIDELFRLHFAPGLDRLLETRWYSSRGVDVLRRTPSINDFVQECSHHFRTSDPAATPSLQSLEARLVWQLAILPRSASPESDSDQLLADVLARIDVIECLLTGQYLSQDRLPMPPSSTQHSPAEYNERHFWNQLATFTSVHDDGTDPRAQSAIDATLSAMRTILGQMENRDVLYSVAIARHVGGRVAEFHPAQSLNRPDDMNDEIYKLEVARQFVEMEDQKGMTQVIQRICGMAMRSWILQKR